MNFSKTNFWLLTDRLTFTFVFESSDILKQSFCERLNYKLSSQLCFVQQNVAARESRFLIWITFCLRVLLLLFWSGLFTKEFRRSTSKGYSSIGVCVRFSLIPKGVWLSPFKSLVLESTWWSLGSRASSISVKASSASSVSSVSSASIVVVSISALFNDFRKFRNSINTKGHWFSKSSKCVSFLNCFCLNFRYIKYSS